MINSQIPYNKLPEIEYYIKHGNLDLSKQMFEAFRSLDFVNGFLEAFNDNLLEYYLNNLVLADLKYSLELESFPLAITRVFEADTSENALNDEVLNCLIEYFGKVKWMKVISLENLKPTAFKPMLKNIDIYRERKESVVKSYFTNLTLYTAPNQSTAVVSLRQNLEQFIIHYPNKDLPIYSVLGHYQIRAVAPFHALNGLAARAFFSMSFKDVAGNILYLPVAQSILKKRESYQTLMRDVINELSLDSWVKFNVEILSDSCNKMVTQLKAFSRLKRSLFEITQKYPDYNMPAEIVEVLMCHPYVKSQDIINKLNCHRHSAYTYLKHLVKMGVLIEKTSGREKMYFNRELLDIIAG